MSIFSWGQTEIKPSSFPLNLYCSQACQRYSSDHCCYSHTLSWILCPPLCPDWFSGEPGTCQACPWIPHKFSLSSEHGSTKSIFRMNWKCQIHSSACSLSILVGALLLKASTQWKCRLKGLSHTEMTSLGKEAASPVFCLVLPPRLLPPSTMSVLEITCSILWMCQAWCLVVNIFIL